MEETLTVKILGETKQLTSQLSSLKTNLLSIGGIASSVTSTTTAALKTGAKAVAAYSAAIGTSIVAITKQSVEAYSSYEQLVGGVDKLYGKASATVQKNAAAAYATTGLTANEYMEMATSYAAALNASLNGNVQESAKVTDMAIQDMADNASIFGSSMESIQNAYNGFAKQNYTMLDNLKLGYGGTMEEMERLLADAEKISGVKYDIDNLSDVYNAIHVIQQELKITGNAAAEASKTIEGSANATKAAWGNLLIELAKTNGDVKGAFSKLAESALNLVNNVVPVISRIFAAIKDSLPKIINSIKKNLSSLTKEFIGIASSFIDVIVTISPIILQTISTIITSIISSLVSKFPQILNSMMGLGVQLLNTITTYGPKLIKNIEELLPQVITTLQAAIPTIMNALTDALQNSFFYVQGIFREILLFIRDAAPSIIPCLYYAFTMVIGILSNQSSLIIDTLLTIGQEILNEIAKELPEYVAVAIEEFIPEISEVLMDALPQLLRTINSMVPSLIQLIENIISALSNLIIESAPEIINFIGSLVSQIALSLVDNLPVIIDTLLTLGQEVLNEIANILPNIVDAVIEVIPEISESLINALPQLLQTLNSMTPSLIELMESIISTLSNLIIESAPEIVNFIGGLADKIALSLVENLPVIVDTLLDLGQEILDMLIEYLPDIVDAVIEVIPEISEGLMDALPQLLAAAAFLITELLKEFPKYMKSWAKVGVNIVAGIWKGLSNSTGWIKNKIKEWVGNVLDFFKELFGIHSPSTVFEEYGGYMVEGLILGVDGKKDEAIVSFEDLRDETDTICLSDLLSQIEEAEEKTVNEVGRRGYTGWQVSDFGTHFPISRETVANSNGRRGYTGWQVSDFGTHFPSSRDTSSSTEVVLNVDGTTLARAVCQNINQITADTGTMPLNIY